MSSILKVDTINEVTSANGVTVDGLSIKDSKLVTANSVVTTNVTDANITSGKIADDAVTLAKMASGTDGNIISYDASGNPVAVATGSAGQVLTSAGAGAPPTFAAAGGLSMADQWRLSANKTNVGTSDTTFDSNLEQIDTSGQNTVGTAMTESSGVFTFPATGVYWVTFNASFAKDADYRAVYTTIRTGSTDLAQSYAFLINDFADDTFCNVTATTFFHCSDTSNDTIYFRATNVGGGEVTALGSSTKNLTTMTFVKLD